MAGVLDRAHGVDRENADDRQIKELVAAGDTCERAPRSRRQQPRLEGFRCADCTSRPFSGIDRRPYDGAVLQTYHRGLVVDEVKIAGVSTATAAARLEQWAGAPTWADGVALEASSVLQRRACPSAPARKDRSRRH